jgi:hypothetical protein
VKSLRLIPARTVLMFMQVKKNMSEFATP